MNGHLPILSAAATLNVATNQNGMGMPMTNGMRMGSYKLLPKQVDYQVSVDQRNQYRMINLRMADRSISIVKNNQQLLVINRDANAKVISISIYSQNGVKPSKVYWRQFNGTFSSGNHSLGMLSEEKRILVDDLNGFEVDQLNSLIDIRQLGDVPYSATMDNVVINKRTGKVKGMIQLTLPLFDFSFNVPINAIIMKRNLKDNPDIFNLTNLTKSGHFSGKAKTSFNSEWIRKALRENSKHRSRINKKNMPKAFE